MIHYDLITTFLRNYLPGWQITFMTNERSDSLRLTLERHFCIWDLMNDEDFARQLCGEVGKLKEAASRIAKPKKRRPVYRRKVVRP